jgi:predicted RND superfamily exporter protein
MESLNTAQWKKRARWTLICITLISMAMAWRVSQIGFNYDFESFFPQDDEHTTFYLDFRDRFESDNDFLIVGLESPKGIYDADFLRDVDGYAKELGQLPYVTSVISPTQIREPIRMGLSLVQRPLLRWQSQDSLVSSYLKADSIRISERSNYIGTLIAENGSALVLQVAHKQQLSKEGCDELANAILDLTSTWKHSSHVAGRAVAQKYYVNVMQREVVLFVAVGMFIIVLFLWLAFHSAWGVIIPLLVVLLSGLWTLGIMECTGKSIDVMTIVLPTIIFVVGISDVVHILSRYYEELRNEVSQSMAIATAFKEVGLATFLTTLTTAIGFLTLTTSSVEPIQTFGVYAATGVGVAYVLAFSLLPAVMILYPAPKISNQGSGTFWNRILQRALGHALKRGKWIRWAALVICTLAAIGAAQIEVNNVLLEDLADDDPFRQEFNFFEREFAGVRPFELAVAVDENASIYDLAVQEDMAKVTAYLKEHYGVGAVVSSDVIFSQINRWSNGDAASFDRLPSSQRKFDSMLKSIDRFGAEQVLNVVAHEPTNSLRIFGKLSDLGAQHYKQKNEELAKWFAASLPDSPLSLRVTGTAQLIDINIGSLAGDMVKGLSIAFLIVAVIAGLMFRSITMVFISLIPNFIPLLLIAGIMGWTGIDLKLSTSIIFTIAFGIAVDDTIHFISKLRIQLAKGRSLPYAVKRSFIGAGKAIIITSIILCGGFITLSLSSFLGTFYIGVLISLTLLFAVLADLFVLPWLVLMLLSQREK